jgi:hypothetical protein
MKLVKVIIGDKVIDFNNLDNGLELGLELMKLGITWGYYKDKGEFVRELCYMRLKPLELEKKYKELKLVSDDESVVDLIELTYIWNMVYSGQKENEFYIIDNVKFDNMEIETLIERNTHERIVAVINKNWLELGYNKEYLEYDLR